MATLTLMPADREDQHLAQLVWKHFESGICETVREVADELSEQGQAASDGTEEN